MIELDDVSWWPRVTHAGVVYAVAPRYITGAAITDVLARQNDAELPSPDLVDAIWRAAAVRCDPKRLERRHDGSHAQMASAAVLEDQRIRVEMEIVRSRADQQPASGRSALIIAGTHKDIVRADRDYFDDRGNLQLRSGALGIYGWHRLDGSVIQPPAGVHAKGYVDYSQGLRLVRRVADAPHAAA